ncbi:MAG: hypothetical protein ABR500_02420 [Dermatophilaceae bacterium]|nr:hypothetical protein [Intrasporangiaceae bacterium]
MRSSSQPASPRHNEQRLAPLPGSAVADLGKAPLPTAATLRKRQNIPLQLTRFAAYNVRIMRMVLKGHAKH